MSFTLCTSGAITIKAGANVNSTAATSGTILEQVSNEAEALANNMARYDWVSNYASLDTNSKVILGEVTSNLAAAYLIAYDMSGYTNIGEAESMITILRDGALRGLSLLRDKKTEEFLT